MPPEARGDRAPAPSLPSVPLSLARAALPVKRGARQDTSLPAARAEVTGYRVAQDKLAGYRHLVGSAAVMPLAFPQLVATALHLDLVSAWSFPVRAMGLVHPGFRVEVLDEIPVHEPWDMSAWVEGERHVRSGLEFDLRAELRVGARPVWRSQAVTLARSKEAAGSDASESPHVELPGQWSDSLDFTAPSDIGRRFGRLSGDINLIHLHPVSARVFGFKHPIAHGWWLLGRIAAMLDRDEAVAGRRVEIAFRRPIPLPSQPQLEVALDGAGAVFALQLPKSDRPAVTGLLSG